MKQRRAAQRQACRSSGASVVYESNQAHNSLRAPLSSSSLSSSSSSHTTFTSNNSDNKCPTKDISSIWPSSLNIGGCCNALSLSPNHKLLVVAGRDVLKVLRVESGRLSPSPLHNLRTGKVNLTFSSNDVQFNPNNEFSHLLCTAATNGKVVIWNLMAQGSMRQEYILSDHTRTVNRIDWHRNQPHVIISGSQDGTIKLWDIRANTKCQHTLLERRSSVRDVQWSPFMSHCLASGLEDGVVQTWDIRSPDTPLLSIAAHQGLVLALDWHPQKMHVLASGGRDRLIKIWDTLDSIEPLHTIQTIASVSRIAWRPEYPTHIASLSTLFDTRIHVWSTRRPFIPVATISSHRDVPTGIEWLSSGKQIVSCSKDATVSLNDMMNAVCPFELIRTCALSWSVENSLAFVNNAVDRGSLCDIKDRAEEFPCKIQSGDLYERPAGRVHIFADAMKAVGECGRDNFNYFAKRYRLRGASMKQLCNHNAQVANECNRPDIKMIWQIFDEFFCNKYENFDSRELNSEQASLHETSLNLAPENAVFEAISSDSVFALHNRLRHVNTSETTSTRAANINTPYSLILSSHTHTVENTSLTSAGNNVINGLNLEDAGEISTLSLFECLPTFDGNNNDHSVINTFNFEGIHTILKNLIELGDIQTCVALVAVFRDVKIPLLMIRQWFASYIDLLHRRKLWVAANEVITASPDEAIKRMNQNSTKVFQSCSRCEKSMSSRGPFCQKCSLISARCSLCRERVDGLFLWCQGCGHGGHQSHLREWFGSGNTQCPTGCSHHCTFKSSVTLRDGVST